MCVFVKFIWINEFSFVLLHTIIIYNIDMNKLLIAILAFLSPLFSMAQGHFPTDEMVKGMVEAMPYPQIPNYSVNIKDFGGDFNKAMKALASKGGGRLIVPSGIWNTGPIEFESNCELHVEAGALVLFKSDYDLYKDVEVVYEGHKMRKKMSPLYAYNKHDVAITGPGSFDGNGQDWRPVKRSKLTEGQWKELIKKGGTVENDVWVPEIRERSKTRPVMLDFIKCERVLLKDATFSNSPAWNLHPFLCKNVMIEGVTVRNPWYSQNGDGIDLECCDGAIILNTCFDVGDDGICIKAGRDKEGRELKAPCQNVLIENCTVYHGHGGFTVGSEMSSGVKNVFVRNCTFIGTDAGLRFKSTRGRGGVVENIIIQDINMVDIAGDAITFDLYYANRSVLEGYEAGSSDSDPVPPVTEETPSFRKILVDNVNCQGAKRAIYMNGLPEMPINNIVLNNVHIIAEKGVVTKNVKDIFTKDVTVNGETIEIK